MADLTGLRLRIEERARKAAHEAVETVLDAIAQAAPKGETGRLAESFSADQVDDTPVIAHQIVSSSDYAEMVTTGTRPHRIEGGPLLVFDWPKAGGTVYFRHVDHPGTAANSFIADTCRREWGPALERAYAGLGG